MVTTVSRREPLCGPRAGDGEDNSTPFYSNVLSVVVDTHRKRRPAAVLAIVLGHRFQLRKPQIGQTVHIVVVWFFR